MKPMNKDGIIQYLQQQLPGLMAVYAFGSRISGTSTTNSDLDMAVLVPAQVDSLELWHMANHLTEVAHCHVDLLDFRAASTVMQNQILSTGVCWWALDHNVASYEATVLNQFTHLNEDRAQLLKDIQQRGTVYG